MSEIAGYTNQVWIRAGEAAITNVTGALINGVDNSSYANLCEILDITAFGNTYKNRLAGNKDTTISISGNYYASDATGQALLIPGDHIFIGCYPSGTGVAASQVHAIVESYEISSDASGKQTFSAAFSAISAPVALPTR